MRILTENLTFTYSKDTKSLAFKALNGVSVDIPEGEFCAIIGRTGSGKSTFVQHLNGLIKVQKGGGKVVVGEFDLTDPKCDFKALRKRVGMMFQYPEHQLFAETVEEDVSFALKNFSPDLKDAERAELVRSALKTVGLDYDRVKDLSPFDMSGGQKRRVAIAGVLVAKPEVLILDEPAAGLDPKGKREFLQLLKKLHNEYIKTVIIVSHDMDLVAEYCSYCIAINGGRVMTAGTPKDVFSKADLLLNAGLDLPLTARLTRELAKRGVVIENDYTSDGFADAFAEYCRKNKGGKTV